MSQRNANNVNRMFIDAYEDNMNVNSVAGSVAGQTPPKKNWPPTIDDHSTVGNRRVPAGAYTDDEAYADDDANSIAGIRHLASAGVGDYTDAYDALEDDTHTAAASRARVRNVSATPSSGVLSDNTLVSENASAYTTDVEGNDVYADALRPTSRKKPMMRAGEMVKSMWPYEVMSIRGVPLYGTGAAGLARLSTDFNVASAFICFLFGRSFFSK